MASSYDIVTVAFEDDLNALRLQARSFVRFLDPAHVGRIIIIINENKPAKARHLTEQVVLPAYEHLQDRVVVINGPSLVPPIFKSGWISQQVLKLAIARFITASHYVVMDTKNHLVKPYGIDDIVDPESGQPLLTRGLVKHLSMREKMDESFKWLGAPAPHEEDIVAHPVTPFVFITEKVRDLIAHLEKTEGDTIPLVFQKHRKVTEFYVYQAFLARDGAITDHYTVHFWQCVAFFRSHDLEGEKWSHNKRALEKAAKLLAIHRRLFDDLTAGQLDDKRRYFLDFWRAIDLLRDDEPDSLFMRARLSAEDIKAAGSKARPSLLPSALYNWLSGLRDRRALRQKEDRVSAE